MVSIVVRLFQFQAMARKVVCDQILVGLKKLV